MSDLKTFAEKNPIQLYNEVVVGGAKITIANNPNTYEYLPKGSPVQNDATEINTYKLIKGVKIYEGATGTTQKVSKDNLLGVGDVIDFGGTDGTVTAIDYSNDLYDSVTFDVSVTSVTGTVYNEEITTKVFFTSDTQKFDKSGDVMISVIYDGIVDLAKLNLHASLTASNLGGKVSLLSDLR